MSQQINKEDFLYQKRSYHGQFTPQTLMFNANLQEFATRVSYISNLQTLGKLSPEDSYQRIDTLWKQLKSSYSALELNSNTQNQG